MVQYKKQNILQGHGDTVLESNLVAGIALILGITFCALLNRDLFTIPCILFFISICLYILFKENGRKCIPFWIGMIVTIIAFEIAGAKCEYNFEKSGVPEESTINEVICEVEP